MRLKLLFFILLIGLVGCRKQTAVNDAFSTIDISKKYPNKEVSLQDIADIEYVALETTDTILLDEYCKISYISDKYIVAYQSAKGDIFIFYRNGKISSHFNHKGQSGREYASIIDIVFDEVNDEIFVFDNYSTHRIQVYSLSGEYKRTLKYLDNLRIKGYNFDDETILVYDDNGSLNTNGLLNTFSEMPYQLLSKKDGSLIFVLNIKFPVRYSYFATVESQRNGQKFNNKFSIPLPNNRSYGKDFIIMDISSDTVYKFSENKELDILLVRNKMINRSYDKFTGWTSVLTTDKFTVFITVTGDENNFYLPKDTLMHNFITRETNRITFINDDFPSEKWSPAIGVQFSQKNLAANFILIPNIYDAYNDKKLKGELEKIAAKMDIEDNPIVMIVKFK